MMAPENGQLHRYVEEQEDNICGIAAMRDGKLLYSDHWHGYGPADTVHVMSVTKSVASLLVGIAIDRGLIADVGQPVLDFFPDYTVKRGEKTIQSVTLEHLLTMTAPYKYKSEPWTKICTSPDWTRATLDILGGRAGLQGEFRYSTLGVHILTAVIDRVSGMRTVDFANRCLFEPIGIARHSVFEAKTAQEHKAFIMSKAPMGDVWFSDPQGVGTAGYGLCLSPEDMARLGQLCLNGGAWEGRQVVSSRWIEESTRPRIQCGADFGGMQYGFLWWTPDRDRRAYAALGNGGNAIYIDPESATAVAVAGTFKPRIYDRVDFIREHVLPLLDSAQ